MKAMFKNLLNGYTGCVDDIVIYYNKKTGKICIRKRPKYKNHPAHAPFKATMANLKTINPSEAYRNDLKEYLRQFAKTARNELNYSISWNNLWMKMMFMLARINPNVNLQTIREDIYNLNLPCKTVKDAIIAGLLPRIKNYAGLDKTI
jgi:hypothetical protein